MQPLPLRFREWGGWEDGYSALFLEVASLGREESVGGASLPGGPRGRRPAALHLAAADDRGESPGS